METDTKTGMVEKKELVVISYAKTFDKDMSYLKAGLTDEEILELEGDKGFQSRLKYCLIEEREDMIERLKMFSKSENDTVAYKALMDLAKVLYQDFFEAAKSDNTITVKIEQ